MGGLRTTEPAVVHVLGSVAIEGPKGAAVVRGRQPAAVAAFLALEQRAVTRDELAELLWAEQLSSHWQSALRGVVSKVRSGFVEAGLPATALRSDDTVVRIDLEMCTDLELVERLVDLDASTEADLAAAKLTLSQPFLPHDDSNWGRHVRERIRRTTQRVTHRHAEVLRLSGRTEQAITDLRSAVAKDSLDETAHHLLIEMLLASGRQTEASDVLDTLTTHLAFELGVPPAQATLDLFGTPDRSVAAVTSQTSNDEPRSRTTLHPHADEPFVGRQRELATLGRAWADMVASGRPALVIVEGPSGIGKTRLADHFYDSRSAEVGLVMWGRNRAARDHAFGAIAEAVHGLVDGQPSLIDRLGDRAEGLWPLLPRIAPADVHRDDASIRRVMIGSLRALLREVGNTPTLWLVDDLHWASPDEITVLESVVDGLQVPVLIIATTRALPADLASALGALQRVLPTTLLKLASLSVDEVGELVTDRGMATMLQARTGGLPFYVSEVAREARLADHVIDVDSVPASITDWVLRRVQALTPSEAECVRLASVIGQDVDLGVLGRCSSIEPAAQSLAIDDLVDSGLLAFAGDEALQFSHAITRDAIYGGIGSASRMHMHRRVAEAIAEQHHRADRPPNHALLAHHYGSAGVDSRLLAWTHAMHAARQSTRAGAWSTAASHYEQAMHWASNPRRRLQAMVGAGRAHVAEGELAVARTKLYDAVELAEQHEFPTLQAAATLALVGRAGRGAVVDASNHEQARLLRSALAALGRVQGMASPRGLELWSDLERELAFVLLLTGPADERNELLHGSLERARCIRPDRPRAVARGLLGLRYAKLDPTQLGARIIDAQEVLAMPARATGSEVRLAAFCYLHEDLLRQGDHDGSEQALDQAERLAERYPHSYWTWAIRTWRALWLLRAGDADAAEASALAAAAMRRGIAEAEATLAVNLTNIRLDQGRAAEMLPALAAAVAAHPEIPTYRAVQALCAAESGDLTLAGDVLASFLERGFTDLPDDPNRFLGLAVLAHVAASFGERSASDLLLPLLNPYRHQWVVLQCYGGGGATWGPAAHALARLADTAGRHDEARDHYVVARRLAAGSPSALARIERDDLHGRAS
jgi:DNA-binding SARP family transcriptional activator/tetratricopeptide (TPR) repeat protein